MEGSGSAAAIAVDEVFLAVFANGALIVIVLVGTIVWLIKNGRLRDRYGGLNVGEMGEFIAQIFVLYTFSICAFGDIFLHIPFSAVVRHFGDDRIADISIAVVIEEIFRLSNRLGLKF